jgi:Ni/Co efflux regulator RcnB
MMKKLLMTIVATTFAAGAYAQMEPAAKETGKAIAESSKEAGDNMKAAVSSEPHKTMDKAKAHVHKAKARRHRHKAKKAADAAVH